MPLLCGSVVKDLPARQEMWARSLGLEDPLQKEMATHSSILALPGKSHGQSSLVGYSLWGPKESDMTGYSNNNKQVCS